MSSPAPRRAVTMNDVATAAGVSVKTVSNVVNDYPHVRPATRAKVQRAIDALGYRMNMTARSLRRGRTGMIGLALPELSLPYFAELADSVIRAAEAHGLIVLIEQTGATRERELDVLTSERRDLTDGLVFSPLALGPDDAEALEVPYPLVVLGERIFDGPWDHVTMSNIDAAQAATEHLLARGRRRIALVGAHTDESMGSATLRIEGYRRALAARRVPFDPDLLLGTGPWHRSTGAATIERALDDRLEFDAIFGLNDTLALGAMHALRSRGIDVPRQVAVIGFDDIEDASFSSPPMSSIAPGREQIAHDAVGLLAARIAGDGPPPGRIVADFRLVERESTAP